VVNNNSMTRCGGKLCQHHAQRVNADERELYVQAQPLLHGP
jgi:hypothetical protein